MCFERLKRNEQNMSLNNNERTKWRKKNERAQCYVNGDNKNDQQDDKNSKNDKNNIIPPLKSRSRLKIVIQPVMKIKWLFSSSFSSSNPHYTNNFYMLKFSYLIQKIILFWWPGGWWKPNTWKRKIDWVMKWAWRRWLCIPSQTMAYI